MKKQNIWQTLFSLSAEEKELFKESFPKKFDRVLFCICWVVILRPYLNLTTYSPKWEQEMHIRQRNEKQAQFNEMHKIAHEQMGKGK